MPLPRILMVGPFRAWPSLISALSQNAILLVVNLDPAQNSKPWYGLHGEREERISYLDLDPSDRAAVAGFCIDELAEHGRSISKCISFVCQDDCAHKLQPVQMLWFNSALKHLRETLCSANHDYAHIRWTVQGLRVDAQIQARSEAIAQEMAIILTHVGPIRIP
jgi:hypothetical protein